MPSTSDIEHLLRRTEFVARPTRVAELSALPSLAAAVDDVLAVPADPGSVVFRQVGDWQRSEELVHFWLDRMAHDSPRPFQEKVAFFWHGHLCSSSSKVGSAELMREQIDLFRHHGLGDLRTLATAMSTQVAMLRYLDNNQNKRSAPNQNFARELMELFLLGVGNYTEADVEAATAAWTGHTDRWDTGAYVWREDWHDDSDKWFLGQLINQGTDTTGHGVETIDVILGDGVVPSGAIVASNRNRATRAVAAEFISKKLWIELAGIARLDRRFELAVAGVDGLLVHAVAGQRQLGEDDELRREVPNHPGVLGDVERQVAECGDRLPEPEPERRVHARSLTPGRVPV